MVRLANLSGQVLTYVFCSRFDFAVRQGSFQFGQAAGADLGVHERNRFEMFQAAKIVDDCVGVVVAG